MNAQRLFVSAVAIVLLLLTAPNPVSVAHGDEDASGATLARMNADYLSDLQPLNPDTLADEGEQIAPQSDEMFEPGTMVISADGKTIAGLNLKNEIVVEEAAARTIKARINPHGSAWPSALNEDGSQILITVDADYSDANLHPTAWKVFDVATGNVTATIQGDDTHGGWSNFQVDPVSWRMYQLLETGPGSEITMETQPAQLAVIDLNSGNEAGRVDLPDVQIGSWTDESRGDEATGESLFVAFSPGLAISPDGRQIAIVHATDDGITLVDAAALKVERSLTMKPKTSLIDHLFSLLPLAPQTASAKMAEMTNARATYTADGDQLFVYGDDSQIKDDQPVFNGRGISLVDLKDGTIEAHALDGFAVDQFVTLPGDDGIYIAGTEWLDYSPSMNPPYMIAHLDRESLDVLATRELPTYVLLVVLPSPQT
jgi:hypothetical protein